MYGPELYDLAKHLSRERQTAAESHNLALRVRRSPHHPPSSPGSPQNRGRWTLEWAHTGFTGARVTLRNEETGQRMTGRHPFDWDQAMAAALGESGLLT